MTIRWPVTVALLGLVSCSTFRPAAGPTVERAAAPTAAGPLAAFPGKHSLRVSQYVFFADFELKADLPLFRELAELRDRVHRDLHLPPGVGVIQVYLFEDRDKYERFMGQRYPELPKRRAFFVAQPRTVGGADELMVFTYWGDRIRQDLRHELTHALLHSGLKDVPLWLDEGLAEYFELPPDQGGINYQHLETLRRSPFSANLPRLEGMTQVQQMTPAEYREAWAWVYWMLNGSPEGKTALLAYLQQLRLTPNPGSLAQKLTAAHRSTTDDLLDAHLRQTAKRLDLDR